MAILKLTMFVDTTQGGFVSGLLSAEPVSLRPFGWKEKLSWQIQLLARQADKGYSAPFVVVDPSAVTMKLGLALPGASPLAQQSTWTYNGTPNFNITGQIDLSTADMAAAFASPAVTTINPILEIQLTDASGTITPIHQTVTIFRGLTLT